MNVPGSLPGSGWVANGAGAGIHDNLTVDT